LEDTTAMNNQLRTGADKGQKKLLGNTFSICLQKKYGTIIL
jgi:hypothetical protein